MLHDSIPLFARVVVDKVLVFSAFLDVIVHHIPHKHSDDMQIKSEQASNTDVHIPWVWKLRKNSV